MLSWRLILLLVIALPAFSETTAPAAPGPLIFERTVEPRERAFSFLKPAGWRAVGGIVRQDPLAVGPRNDVVAPQLDLTIARDAEGTARLHWLPNVVYCDVRQSPGAGLFPPGSSYQGMLVYPLMTAHDFLLKMLLTAAHPRASEFEFIEQRRLPELAAQYQRRVHALRVAARGHYDAATLTLKYEEDGVTYLERWLTVIEDRGALGGGQWGNKETLVFRAPQTEFAALEPLFSVIQSSLAADPEWLAREVQTQAERGDIPLNTRAELAQVDSQIAAHRRLTNAQIHQHVFVAFDDRQDFLNPFTGIAEMGFEPLALLLGGCAGNADLFERRRLRPEPRSAVCRAALSKMRVDPAHQRQMMICTKDETGSLLAGSLFGMQADGIRRRYSPAGARRPRGE